MKTVKLPLPYYKRKSKALFTMNIFRNAHYRSQASFKNKYGAICEKAIKDTYYPTLPHYEQISVHYTIYLPLTKGNPTKANPMKGRHHKDLDLLNSLAMVDKTFLDILSKLAIIPDDTITHLRYESFKYEVTDEPEGLIEVTIKEVTNDIT